MVEEALLRRDLWDVCDIRPLCKPGDMFTGNTESLDVIDSELFVRCNV